ncbi:MAG: ATP-grasp domain-containing protein [Terriglobia bacterium]
MAVCPTLRDHRELGIVCGRQITVLSHDYATTALEDLSASEPSAELIIDPPEVEIERILTRCVSEEVQAIVSTDDYPGATIAAIVAQRLNLPGVSPEANLLCQHKYLSRRIQRAAAPEAVPKFYLLDANPEAGLPPDLKFPVFVKPVKSFFSVGAGRVDSLDQLRSIQNEWLNKASFFQPFDAMLRKYAGHAMRTEFLLAEEVLTGWQTTLDGYVYDGEVYPVGVVDSIMFPGTIAFQRFEYPSRLPDGVQNRMCGIAKKVMGEMNFGDGQFNMEFIYDAAADTVRIVEINPRMSSQFGDLYEKVDGRNSYSVMLDLAMGRRPSPKGKGRHAMAASCVQRTFQNQKVVKLPSPRQVEKLLEQYPDMRIEILATEGLRLSQQMQDSCSYRYGLINIGGRDREEILDIFDHCSKELTFVFEAA